MLFEAVTNGEIKQMLADQLVNFTDRVWTFLTNKEEDGDGETLSPIAKYKRAYKNEEEDAQQNNREPDHSEEIEDLFTTALMYIVQQPAMDQPQPDASISRLRPRFRKNLACSAPGWIYEISEMLALEDLTRLNAILLDQAIDIRGWDWVKQFREIIPARGSMTASQMDRYLVEPALRLLPNSQLIGFGVPEEGPASFLLEDDCCILPDGRQRFVVVLQNSGQKLHVVHHPASARAWDGAAGELTNTQKEYYHLTYYPGSAFEDAMNAAHRLEERSGWEHEQALNFLLTNQVPDVEPVDVVCRNTFPGAGEAEGLTMKDLATCKLSHIILKLPIWLSADMVMKVFRHMQNEALRMDNRPISVQYLRLFLFVLTQRWRLGIQGIGSEQQRREVWKQWNLLCSKPDVARASHPEMETYRGQWSDLNEDWRVESFAYFNTICSRVQERLQPMANI